MVHGQSNNEITSVLIRKSWTQGVYIRAHDLGLKEEKEKKKEKEVVVSVTSFSC